MSRKFTGSQAGQDGVRMREDDGNPDAHGVSEVIVTNGTLTALGNGIVELSTGGGGGTCLQRLLSIRSFNIPSLFIKRGHTF